MILKLFVIPDKNKDRLLVNIFLGEQVLFFATWHHLNLINTLKIELKS